MSGAEREVYARDFQPEDFATLCEIDRLCFPPGIAYSPEDISIVLLEPGAFVVVGCVDAATAGFILARNEARRAHIITIDVLSQFRRRGLGTLLLTEAHRRLQALGAARVVLEVSVENPAAIALYEKHGYATERRLKNYYLDREDAWRMARPL